MTFLSIAARRLSLRAHFGTDKHPAALGNLYFALFLGDPFLDGIEPDPAIGNYSRASVTNDLVLWGTVAPDQVEITTLVDIVWPAATGPWSIVDTLTHWGVFDVPVADGGVLWYADEIGSGGFEVRAVGAQPRILAGGITILQGG